MLPTRPIIPGVFEDESVASGASSRRQSGQYFLRGPLAAVVLTLLLLHLSITFVA